MPNPVSDTSTDDVQSVTATARQKAEEMDLAMNITVVDAGANLEGFLRMDGVWLGSVDVAIEKAETARYFDMNSGQVGELSQPGGSLYGIEHLNGGLISFPGGVTLEDASSNVTGAVGVSGSTVDDDHEVASAGAEVL